MYSFFLQPILISNFDDITLVSHKIFCPMECFSQETWHLHDKYTLKLQLKSVTCSHIYWWIAHSALYRDLMILWRMLMLMFLIPLNQLDLLKKLIDEPYKVFEGNRDTIGKIFSLFGLKVSLWSTVVPIYLYSCTIFISWLLTSNALMVDVRAFPMEINDHLLRFWGIQFQIIHPAPPRKCIQFRLKLSFRVCIISDECVIRVFDFSLL